MTLRDYAIPAEIRHRARLAEQRRRNRKLITLGTLGVAGILAGLLVGCSGGMNPSTSSTAAATATTPAVSHTDLAGNWKFSSTASNAHALSAVAGSLAVNGSTISGTLHPLTATCAAPSAAFQVTGSVDANNVVTLASTNFSAGTFTVSGTAAGDGRSLSAVTYNVTNGACAFPALASHTAEAQDTTTPTTPTTSAQQFQPITGNYAGSFTDGSGEVLPLTATLSQPTTPDADGVYHLTGYATFNQNPCLNTPAVTDSTVTGDTISATYTDSQTHNTVTGNGTFTADAATLTITNWVLTGTCGNDTGTGTLTRQ